MPPFGNNENPKFLNIILTDEQGSIMWLDLTSFIRQPLREASESELCEFLSSSSK